MIDHDLKVNSSHVGVRLGEVILVLLEEVDEAQAKVRLLESTDMYLVI